MTDDTADAERRAKHAAYMRQWSAANREKVRAWNRAGSARRRQDPAYVERERERNREYYRQHPEKKGAWAQANRDRSNAIKKSWKDEHREETLRSEAQYRKENRDACAERIKDWWKRNRTRVAEYAARRYAAKKNNGIFIIIDKDLARLFRDGCFYCGAEATQMDHVIPITRGGPHSIGNLVGACGPCNRSKSADLIVEWKNRR